MTPCPPAGAPLLPPVRAGWPAVVLAGADDPAAPADAVAAALAAIRAETLWWPVPRRAATQPRALALGAAGLAAARACFDDAEIAAVAAGPALDAAAVDPVRLEAVYAPPASPVAAWAAMGGLDADATTTASLLSCARGVSPWGGGALALAAAVEAQATLRRAVSRVGGRAGLVAMSRWKRRCIAPFLPGADGPPVAAPSVAAALARGLTPVVWGAAEAEADDQAGVLRAEDGFLRSVGLGLRHVPPLSLAIDHGPPHFDATRRTAFEALVARAAFTPALLGALAALTKYNLPDAAPLPDPGGRLALLAPGQVATDASIRLGARAVRDDAALLAAARARFPDAFLLYKPHPDAVSGLRRGALSATAAARWADATVTRASADACLRWAGRVATITSLAGFEGLMRGKPVSVFGRPFYAGWGLTDDADPPLRDGRLSLDELVAAALILHASYIDPATGLPAPPEVVIDALERQRASTGRADARLLRAWRDAISWLSNRLG